MTTLEAVLLGIIQGATEFLPVSSSGHLVIAQEYFGLGAGVLTFDVFLHFATIIAVIIFFWKDLWRLRAKDMVPLIVASIPAGIIGVLFHKQFEAMFSSLTWIGVQLIITGGINFWSDALLERDKKRSVAHEAAESVEKSERTTEKPVPLKAAGLMGVLQAVAIIPAISRSGSTVLGGLLAGLDRETAFRFSFIMSIPVILGANALELLKVIKNPSDMPDMTALLWGSVAAFVVGLVSLYVFKYVMTKAKLQWFGWYCVIVGAGLVVLQVVR